MKAPLKKEKKVIKLTRGVISSRLAFFFAFIISTISVTINLEFSLVNLLYLISTELIFAHVLFGGYVILRDQKNFSALLSWFGVLLWLCLMVLFTEWIDKPVRWFLALIIIFAIALVFHSYAMKVNKNKHIRELANRKLYVEICGIFFGWLGIALTKIVQKDLTLGLINLAVVIFVNYIILFKMRIYRKVININQEKKEIKESWSNHKRKYIALLAAQA